MKITLLFLAIAVLMRIAFEAGVQAGQITRDNGSSFVELEQTSNLPPWTTPTPIPRR